MSIFESTWLAIPRDVRVVLSSLTGSPVDDRTPANWIVRYEGEDRWWVEYAIDGDLRNNWSVRSLGARYSVQREMLRIRHCSQGKGLDAETLTRALNAVGAAHAAHCAALASLMSPDSVRRVCDEILTERARQDAKWGEQNHPDGTGLWRNGRKVAADARRNCDVAHANGLGTWQHIFFEEVFEAAAESNPELLRAELIQCAAVTVAWIEAIDRRSAARRPNPPSAAMPHIQLDPHQ